MSDIEAGAGGRDRAASSRRTVSRPRGGRGASHLTKWFPILLARRLALLRSQFGVECTGVALYSENDLLSFRPCVVASAELGSEVNPQSFYLAGAARLKIR